MAVDLVTGAYGNLGRAIAARIVGEGREVRTLTGHPRQRGQDGIDAWPYAFEEPERLRAAFEGVSRFYNTFWMRTGDDSGYETARQRSLALLHAAEQAGVERIVQLSVAHASEASPYPYFRAKAAVEAAARATGVPVAVVRPSLIFGGDSVLLHNLAWTLRRSPIFAVPGDGTYRVRPVHLHDAAGLCVAAGARSDDEVLDAVGPERPTFHELVTSLRDAIGSRARLLRLPAPLVLAAARAIGAIVRDDILTADELRSTMEGLADTDGPATGEQRLSAWIAEHAADLGKTYRNERRARATP